MPLYDYKCKNCGKEFELFHAYKDEAECPHCKSKELNKLPAATSFSLKGEGYHKSGFSSKD